MGKIKVAVAGVGNCCSSLIQGLFFYRDAPGAGLMHNIIGKYKVSDIEFVAAFDVDERKVGKDLGRAIFELPNCAKKFADVPELGVNVEMGEILDGVAEHTQMYDEDKRVKVSNKKPADVVNVLKESGAEILVNYLPVGSERATAFYADAALAAGCAFINCIPVFIASDKVWESKFRSANLPIIGDDIKSQIGATIIHRALARLFSERGVELDKTYQLNFGGNADFLNMLDMSRLKSKKVSKTEAVASQLDMPLAKDNIHIGPSDYVPWLNDNKICYIRMEGRNFGNMPVRLECRLSVEDSPNSAGIVIDAIRCAKLAVDRGIGGALEPASAYFMKHPPKQYPDYIAREKLEEFIRGR